MIKALIFIVALAVPTVVFAATPGGSDFSACTSAVDAKDPHQRIDLFTICLKRGGVGVGAASVIFANRGFTYESVGEVEKAFQDFNSAIQYESDWPYPYFGRAGVESGRGLCKEALADIDKAMKMGPPQAPFLNRKAWILATCADSAVRDGAKAIEGLHELPDRVDAMQARLELYNHGLAFHTVAAAPSAGR